MTWQDFGNMDAEAIAFYAEMERDADEESTRYSPIEDRLQVLRFVSKSKGRGRRRKTPIEVVLVKDVHSGRVSLAKKIAMDEYAESIFPWLAGWDAERRLRAYIDYEV